jgi:hypothetical protein
VFGTSIVVITLLLSVFIVGGNGNGSGVGAVTYRPPDGLAIANGASFRGEGNLAFVSKNRLFVLDGSSGSLRVITSSAHQASNLQFSPNGRWLAYSLDNGQVWLAHADGSSARLVVTSGSLQWLPDGLLLAGNNLWSVATTGIPVRSGLATAGLLGWSPNGNEYVFETDSLTVDPPKTSHGIERLEVSNSLTGKRTLWYETPTSFDSKNGIHGNFIEHVTVLPDNEGLLVSTDPDDADDADGSGLYEIRSPGGAFKELAITLGQNVGGDISVGADGTFVIGAGGDRYAWSNKSVEICSVTVQTCTPIRTSSSILSLDPAWSPNYSALAFVEAAKMPEGNIGQQVVARWYATHELALLTSSSSQPHVLPGTKGAATPIWSSNGKSLLYVSNDGLWLIRKIGMVPVEIVAPLFAPGAWPSFYGEVNWTDEFAWSHA